MKRTHWHHLWIVPLLAAGLFALAWGSLRPLAQGSPEIAFSGPSPPEIWAGDPPTWVDIVLTGTELYGYEFVVEFDPLMLEAVDSEFVDDFLKAEFIPPGWNGTIDNVAGTVHFAATQTYPTPPATGSGVVARVAFRGHVLPDLPEYTQLAIREARAADREGNGFPMDETFRVVLVLLPIKISVGVQGTCGVDWMPGECLSTTLVMTGGNIYGYQYIVTFDPALLEAESAGFYDDFVQADFSPSGWSGTMDNVAGAVRFATTQEYPALPASGGGPIGWICFQRLAGLTVDVTTALGIVQPLAATKEAIPMTPLGVPAVITLSPLSAVHGQVEMQGRTDYSRCVASALPSPVTDITEGDGWYALTLCSDAVYTVTLEMERYLDTWRVVTTIPGLNLLPTVLLLGGDANDDDIVDISDLSIIGGKYRQAVDPLSERADINADAVVDISDISLAGGNYRKRSPVSWP